jgi:hypothetical protein
MGIEHIRINLSVTVRDRIHIAMVGVKLCAEFWRINTGRLGRQGLRATTHFF